MAAIAIALAACAPRDPPSGEDRLADAHAQAVGDFQRAAMSQGPRGEADPPCEQLCASSAYACATADDLCAHAGPGVSCDEARTGCAWTRSMLPQRCRYCAVEGP